MDTDLIPPDPTNPRPMSLKRFRRLVETYGTEAEHWPEAERPAAWSLLALSAAAKEAWRDAAKLDEALRTVTPPAPSGALVARLYDLSLPSDEVKRKNSKYARWLASRWLAWPVAVAATAMLFFALGWSAPDLWKSGGRLPIEPPTLAALNGDAGFEGAVLNVSLVDGMLDNTNLYGDGTLEFAESDAEDDGDTASQEGDFLAALPLY